jgi:hypothetical protein
MFRLYGVSENLDESGQYQLMPLDVDAFNEDIDENEIEDTLTGLTEVLYGHESGCSWYEITDDMFDDGKIGIEIENDKRVLLLRHREDSPIP